MNPITFYLALDRTYLKGTDIQEIRSFQRVGKQHVTCFNPNPTSVYLCCSFRSTFLKVNVGVKVKPAEWDFSLQKPSRKHPLVVEYSAFLQSVRSKAETGYLKMRSDRETINLETIKALLNASVGKQDSVLEATTPKNVKSDGQFWEAFEEYVIERQKLSKKGTMKKYSAIKLVVTDFEKVHYKLSFDKMDYQFYKDFRIFSVDVKKHMNGNIGKNLKSLKAFLHWAELHPKRYHQNQDYKNFKTEGAEGEVLFLTEAELLKIECFNPVSGSSLAISKDIFLFQCYTGQRYSDVINVKMGDIRRNEDGEGCEWVVYQIKGNKKHPIFIPLFGQAKAIYEKYMLLAGKDGKLFPHQCNVILNRNIKEMAKQVGIDSPITKVNYSGTNRVERSEPKYEFLSSHAARRTFVSLSLNRGLRPELIQSITGHTTLAVMKRYIGVSRDTLVSELKDKWDQKRIDVQE